MGNVVAVKEGKGAAPRKRVMLSGHEGAPFSLWFMKRKGFPCTAVASGSAYYGFAASLFGPTGMKIGGSDGKEITFYANVPASSPEGLCRIDFSKGVRGVYDWIYVDLYGAPPFLFLTPDKTWRFR